MDHIPRSPQSGKGLCICQTAAGNRTKHESDCIMYETDQASAVDIQPRGISRRMEGKAKRESSMGLTSGLEVIGIHPSSSSSAGGAGAPVIATPLLGGGYPAASNVSSIAASYTSTSSVLDSAAESESFSSSHMHKRSVSVCSFSSTASSSFYLLPTELFRAVFVYLDFESLKTAALVSRQWRAAANPLIWRTMTFPLDKRRLANMKYALAHFGHYVRRVIITPPMALDTSSSGHHGSSLSRRVSISNPRNWSFSRPISRSSSSNTNANQQQHPGSSAALSESESSGITSTPSLVPQQSTFYSGDVGSPMSTTSSTFGGIASTATTTAAAAAASAVNTSAASGSLFGGGVLSSPTSPPSSMPSSQMPHVYNIAPLSLPPSGSIRSTDSGGRRQSRSSIGASPSPSLPPVYAVPIPGTPGPGNVLSEGQASSLSSQNGILSGSMFGGGSSMGLRGIGGSGGSSTLGSNVNIGSSGHHQHHQYEVSEGTVIRMHQFMERYCQNVQEAVVRNPTGISSHGRRMGILARVFQMYPRLERLDLSDFIMWDVEAMQLVSGQLENLTSLNVTNRVELNDSDLVQVVEKCPRLRELRLRATNISDVTISAIAQNLTHTLTLINVGGCPVSSQAMAELVQKCTRLRVIQAWSCLRLDDRFLLALDPKVQTSLLVIDLMDVPKFSADVVHRVFADNKWPYLMFLRIKAKCSRSDFVGVPGNAVLKFNSQNHH